MSSIRLVVFTAAITVLVAVPTSVFASHQFRDVPADNVHHAAISWLADQGVTSGCNASGDLYCPEDPVTRAQMATFLKRFSENGTTDSGATADGGVPAGAIVMLPAGQPCPSGFSAVSSLNNGSFPRGWNSSGSGGSGSHTHRHDHTHSVSLQTDSGWTTSFGGFSAPQHAYDSSGDFHTHQVTGSTGGVSSSGEHTDSADHLPPYYNVNFCTKG